MKLASLFSVFAFAAAGKNRETVIEIYNDQESCHWEEVEVVLLLTT